ncbi:alpha-tocopherol transfer protein-like [Anabrus simplex]|uniref:alpha-tocopherol transfer protein-like n=1 Tax=Anabrus simplex TaxID=316456 RepID=UPI0035A29FE0
MTELKRVSLETELKRNPQLNRSELEHLKDWVRKQPHLPDVEDQDLVLFLHSCYFRVEPAKNTLDTYFTVRTHVPEYFSKRDPDEPGIKQACNVTCIAPLPSSTPEGYKVMLCRLMDLDPSHYDLAETIKVFLMISDLWQMSEGTAPGFVIAFDMDGVAFGHLTRLSIGPFKKFFYYLQEAMPVRLQGLHFFNLVPFTDKIMAMIKPFMKKELLEMLHLHTGGLESFCKFVPLDILPSDYGGKAPSCKELLALTRPQLVANRSFFKEEEKRRVVEAKRPGKQKNAGDLFGMEGNFKKLEID